MGPEAGQINGGDAGLGGECDVVARGDAQSSHEILVGAEFFDAAGECPEIVDIKGTVVVASM